MKKILSLFTLSLLITVLIIPINFSAKTKAQQISLDDISILPKDTDNYYINTDDNNTIDIDFTLNNPSVKLNKWNDNTYLKLKNDFGLLFDKPILNNNIITYEHTNMDIKIYPTKINNGNGLEYEVILKTKPLGNVFNFNIETNNLVFYYQPELTQEEIDNGHYRPDNVIGSYAVYHKENIGNEFKTGKAYHIYRPMLIDSDNKISYCDLFINEKLGIMSIICDTNFLNNAIYPVILDPTLGYGVIGASDFNPDPERLRTLRVQLNESGIINNIAIRVTTPCTLGSIKFGVYDNNETYNNLPYNLLTESTNVTCSINSWINASTYTSELSSGIYYLAFWSSDNWSNCKLAYDSATYNYSTWNGVRTFNGLPDPLTGQNSNSTNRYSIYANYTASSPTTKYNLTVTYHTGITDLELNGTSKGNNTLTEYNEFQIANITSILDVGYTFLNYKFDNGTLINTSNPYYMNITEEMHIHAYAQESTTTTTTTITTTSYNITTSKLLTTTNISLGLGNNFQVFLTTLYIVFICLAIALFLDSIDFYNKLRTRIGRGNKR